MNSQINLIQTVGPASNLIQAKLPIGSDQGTASQSKNQVSVVLEIEE